MKIKKHSPQIFLFVIIFLLGVFSDRIFSMYYSSSAFPAPARQKGYDYVSPLLYCRYPNTANSKLISRIHNDLNEYITDTTTKGITQDVSVYFHEPTTGEWTTINGSDTYVIASLVKVPLMMMLYKQTEIEPGLLTKKIGYDGSSDDDVENFKPTAPEMLQKGHTYSVDDLIARMIDYSDNTAMDMLESQLKLKTFNDDLEQLNFSPINGGSQTDVSMTAGKYATFFRILYNATYLSPVESEKALKLLTKTTFTSGIVAGVPKNITVAHKFGERAYENVPTKDLHDCGIVYYPNHPYILCIMTRGYDFKSLESVIQTISKKIYESMKSIYK